MLRRANLNGSLIAALSCAVLLGLLSPFLYRLVQWLLGKSYYAHVPIVLLCAAGYSIWAVRKQAAQVEVDPAESSGILENRGVSLRTFAFMLVSCILVGSVWFFDSAWLSLPALLVGCWGIVHFFGGRPLASLIAPAMIIAVVSIPLPVGLDQSLVVALQKLATLLASYWLDLLRIFHVVTGVAIQTPDRAYLVEDACSGISSLFAGICVATLYCIWMQYGIVRSLITILLTVFWLMIANAVRVFLIVFCSVRQGLDLTEGLQHELLGIGTFATGIALALSAERFVLFWVPRKVTSEKTDKRPNAITNRLFGWLDYRFGSFNPQNPRVAAALTVVLVLSGGLGFFGKAYARQSFQASQVVATTDFSTINMPETIGQWRLTHRDVQQRAADDVFGMTSYIWHYQRGDQQMAISVDGPYDEWHDLAVCYTSVGWQLQGYENLILNGIGGQDNGNLTYAVDLHLYREPLDRADVLFACFDRKLELVEPQQMRSAVLANFVTRIRKLIAQTASPFEPPVHQVQVNAQLGDVVSEADRQDLESVLLIALRSVGVNIKTTEDSGAGVGP